MVSQQKFIESTIWFVKISKYWIKSVLNRNNIDYSWNSKIWHSYLVADLLDDGSYAISVALSHVAIIGWHLQFAISFLSNRSAQSNECVLISSREASSTTMKIIASVIIQTWLWAAAAWKYRVPYKLERGFKRIYTKQTNKQRVASSQWESEIVGNFNYML